MSGAIPLPPHMVWRGTSFPLPLLCLYRLKHLKECKYRDFLELFCYLCSDCSAKRGRKQFQVPLLAHIFNLVKISRDFSKAANFGIMLQRIPDARVQKAVAHPPCIIRFLGAFAVLLRATISFVMSLYLSVSLPAWNSTAATGEICMKFGV